MDQCIDNFLRVGSGKVMRAILDWDELQVGNVLLDYFRRVEGREHICRALKNV
jgi:hypothetical protein